MQTINYTDRVFSIKKLLNPHECQDLINIAEQSGFSSAGVRTADGPKAMPFIRNNERTMVEHSVWVDILWSRLSQIFLPPLRGEIAVGLPKDLRFYKYFPGQRFKMHKDGPWKEKGLSSQLTLLIYLNQDFTGGETDFRDFKIIPETGDALLFVHDTWHEGAAVTAGTKYVVRSDVLYSSALAA